MRAPTIVALLLLAACSSQAEPRPQLVLVLDTDMLLPSMVSDGPDPSPAAVIDTVRVDIIDDAGRALDFRNLVAPDRRDWPLSFGVAAPEVPVAGIVRARIRAFRGSTADVGELAGRPTLEPPIELTVDRSVELPFPASGVDTVRIVLHGDCIGIPTAFGARAETCVDGSHLAATLGSGFTHTEDRTSTAVGTWPRAAAAPCASDPPADGICIPGGLSVMGDPELRGIPTVELQPQPARVVELSPFFMDRTEYTVGRFRKLLARTSLKGSLPATGATSAGPACTFVSATAAQNDALPLTCVPYETALEICASDGGTLPSEAQWEHAARGRAGRRYPWGDTRPDCCTASLSRAADAALRQCSGAAPEPVASHLSSDQCTGDVSADGVVDLGGSVSEMVVDAARSYESSCWGLGLRTDPTCNDPTTGVHIRRGGAYTDGLENARAALRGTFVDSQNATLGFRCVYPAGAP